jgi:hypothetical protein
MVSGTGLGLASQGLASQVLALRSLEALAPRAGTPETEHLRPELHFLLPPSSAIYMISCLKMNRLGAPSRVNRTMFLS